MPRTYDPRRAKAGTTYQFVDDAGKVRVLAADDDGVIQPNNDEEQAFADRHEFSIAQKVKADKAEKEA